MGLARADGGFPTKGGLSRFNNGPVIGGSGLVAGNSGIDGPLRQSCGLKEVGRRLSLLKVCRAEEQGVGMSAREGYERPERDERHVRGGRLRGRPTTMSAAAAWSLIRDAGLLVLRAIHLAIGGRDRSGLLCRERRSFPPYMPVGASLQHQKGALTANPHLS